jgi:radical SAM superfamily enzyme YgiQ (UPF0313 family)
MFEFRIKPTFDGHGFSHNRKVLLLSLDWTRDKDPRIPLGHASLLATIKQIGDVNVTSYSFPVNADNFDCQYILQTILQWASNFTSDVLDLCIGVYIWNEGHVTWLLKKLRQARFFGRIILGGPQISYAERGLETLYPEADVFVRGYGEDALSHIIQTSEHITFPGIHWANEEDLCIQAQVDLAQLPSPFLTGTIPITAGVPFLRWETQRGCPYRCTFCQHKGAGEVVKKRALNHQRLNEEIHFFQHLKVSDIAVLDPIFNVGDNHLDILNEFIKVDFNGRLSLQCRFELITSQFLELCEHLNIRLEFGLQTIHESEGRAIRRLNNIGKVDSIIQQLKNLNITYEVSLIYGLPQQTLDSFKQTVDFCLKHKVPTVKAFPLLLLRGTQIERERDKWNLVENNEFIPEVISSNTFTESDWHQMSRIAKRLFESEGNHPLTVEELEGF